MRVTPATRRLWSAYPPWWRARKRRSTHAGSASPDTTEEVNLFGTPEEVIDKIYMFREAFSSDEIMFECNWTSSVPRDVVMDTIRCLSDKVIPAFK